MLKNGLLSPNFGILLLDNAERPAYAAAEDAVTATGSWVSAVTHDAPCTSL